MKNCLGFIGGSGLYDLDFLDNMELLEVQSPWGNPSDKIIKGSIEGNTIFYLKNINLEAWLMILHHGIFCSLMGHMSMFYLYKFYPVGQVLPFYALFPVFGIILSFFIFGEIPTLIMVIGAFFLDEKYEVFGTKSSLLLIIITWGILLIIAAALIGGSFHISKRIYKFIKKKYSNK